MPDLRLFSGDVDEQPGKRSFGNVTAQIQVSSIAAQRGPQSSGIFIQLFVTLCYTSILGRLGYQWQKLLLPASGRGT